MEDRIIEVLEACLGEIEDADIRDEIIELLDLLETDQVIFNVN